MNCVHFFCFLTYYFTKKIIHKVYTKFINYTIKNIHLRFNKTVLLWHGTGTYFIQ